MSEVITPTLPHIGRMLRKLRLERGLSRERLAFAAGVSSSYVTHLEAGKRERPTATVVTALVRQLERTQPCTPAQRRQLDDMSGRIMRPVPTLAELRAEIATTTTDLLASFGELPAACLDIGWNVLACNDSYSAVFPGAGADGNFLHWLYADPRSREILLEWHAEADLCVQMLRGHLATHADLPWCTELLPELSRYADFRRAWETGEVRYHRDRGPMRMRHPATGEPYATQPQVFRFAAGDHHDRVQIHLHVPVR